MSGILFHLAFPIHDIEAAKRFYVDGLGCTLGRESTRAVTFGLQEHQLVAHVVDRAQEEQKGIYPRHFGLVFLSKEPWQALVPASNDPPSTSFRGREAEQEPINLTNSD